MLINKSAINRVTKALRLNTPLIAVYDSAPGDEFEPMSVARGRICCFAFYKRWLKGETLVIKKGKGSFTAPKNGCPGAQISLGLQNKYPPYMAHFLTDGKGAPKGEGLKASPDLAQEFIDHAKAPMLSGDTVLIGPLRLEKWDAVRSVTFFVDPDRLSGVMTLSTFHSGPRDLVIAPFSSGCGLLLRELEGMDRDTAIIGTTDLAMRKYLPPETISLTVSPSRFEKMMDVPDDSFLFRDWWNELMATRERA